MKFWGGQKQCMKIAAYSMEKQSRGTSSLEVVLTGKAGLEECLHNWSGQT